MLSALTMLTLVAFFEPEERSEPPKNEELAAISARGKELAEYDSAAWRASEAILAAKPKEGAVQQYIGRKTQAGWVVSFGHVDPKDGRFLVTHEAVQKAGKPEDFDVRELNPPKGDDTYLQAASKAIDLALKDFVKNFKGEPRPYNVAILPAEKGQFWVYLLPAQTKVGVWPLGGDFRYLLSGDGAKIVAKRQLHKAIIENDPPQKTKDETQVAGMHSHVLDDMPEDTDVFHVLVRKPSVPELIITKRFQYNIDPNGVVTFKGKSEDAPKR